MASIQNLDHTVQALRARVLRMHLLAKHHRTIRPEPAVCQDCRQLSEGG